MRWLLGSITDWGALFAEAYKACKPGGWVESFEASCTAESDHADLPEGSALGQWGKFFTEGGKKLGRTFLVLEDDVQRKAMEAAGFVDIEEFYWKVSSRVSRLVDVCFIRCMYPHLFTEAELTPSQRPLGTWPKDPVYKEIGTMSQLVLESDAEGYILFLANTLGWSRDEVQVYIAHLRGEVRSNRYCPYYRQKIIWGRKPE